MIDLCIGAEYRLESGEVVAEIPFRLFEEQEETRIHPARSLGSHPAETHHRAITAENFLLSHIGIGDIQPARLVFREQVRTELHTDRIYHPALFHHEACNRARFRVAFKTRKQVLRPSRVEFQVHIAKHLNIGIHIVQEPVACARIA